MNYQKIYDALIERAQNRVLVGAYVERHHILPRCMGGGDESSNLVGLTPEEHFVAHQLLLKMHPGVRGIAVSAVLMSGRGAVANKAYGWLKRAWSSAFLGHTKSPEWRANIAAANIGKRAALDTRAKMTATRTGMVQSSETKMKRSATMMGVKKSPEHCAKMREVKQNMSPETKAKISAARIGKYGGANHPSCRSVICVETDQKFWGAIEAVAWLRSTGLPKAGSANICTGCQTGRVRYGYHWRYAD